MGFLREIRLPELIIILVIVLLLFGAKKIPDMARSLGSSVKEFRKGMGSEERGQAAKTEPPETPSAKSDSTRPTH